MGHFKNLEIIKESQFVPEQETTMNKGICPICNKKMAGEIHNAEPVVDGFCCDACNTTVVIPTRLVAAKLKRCWT